MKKFIRFLLVLLAGILLRAPILAQSYPVQATVQLTPPYSLYLADYTAPGSNRILANILLKDLSRQDLQTRLRLTIEGVGVSITTSPNFRPEPLYLQGGLPVMLTAADLAPYFNPDNLIFQGVSKQEVQKGGTLPEGLYRICIQVLDYNLNAEVSNQACGTAWLILNDPPIINLPAQGEKLRAQEPQNVIFQWTPRHTGSPNAAFNTEYDFQLVELWPDNRDPNNAILSSPPIYETTTYSTSLIYGPAETPLEPGRKYAFRVRANAMTGIEEMNLFKNNGYSEVYAFTYGDACTAPGVVSATTVSSSRVEVRWESAPFHTEFTVRYREKSKRGAKWQEKRTYLSDLVVDGLLPQTEYEFQVLGICGSLTGAASETVSMITSEEPLTNFTCGAGPDAFNLENQDPLPELKWGDVFKVGDVEVSVLDVKGGNGTFTGKGLAEMPWLRHAKFRVDYSGVFINSDYQLVRGAVNSVFNPDSKMIVNLDGMDELFGGGGEEEGTDPMTDEEIAHEGEIADVSIDPATGAIVVIDEDGKETAYPEEKDEETGERKSVKIVDSSGDTYIVDKNGNVSKGVGSNGAAPALATTEEPLDFIIQFSPNERQLYGFDAKDHDAFNNYEKAQLQDEEYPIAWKSIEAGRVDYVNAIAEGKTEFPGFISFKTPSMPMASQPADKEAQKQVNLVGGIAGQTDQLIAFALKEDEKGNEIEHELGVLNLVSYAKVRNKVVLVPVNGATVPADVKQEINAIFAKSVAEWDVVIDSKYTVDPSVLADLDAGESGMLASFPKNMRDFIQTFKKGRDEDKNAYYLFIIPGNKGKRAGFMPFKRQFGFIYPANTNNTARTIAHELGHGAFRLRHTFSPEQFIAGQGRTNNLMDYPAGPELRKYQWDNVHEPESMSGWFEDDAEVAMLADAEIPAGYIPECGTEGKPPIVEKLILYSKTCSSHFEGSVTNLLSKGYGAFLCASERFAVIKCLANGLMPGHKEDAIIKLISGTPSVQAAELLKYLKEDNSGIFRKINSSFQLGNYVNVFKAIRQLYLSGTTQAVINAEVEKINSTFSSDQTREEKAQQNYFTWFEGGILKEILSDNFIFSRFDDVSIADDGTVLFNYATDPKQTGETTTPLNIKPFALVGIRVRGNTNEVLEAGNGNLVYVPGIMLPLLVSKKETAEFLDGLNLAAVVTGVGTITTGTSRFLIAVGGVDVLLGSSALVVDSYKDEILKMSHGQEFLDAYILVNNAFLIYFSARSVAQLTKLSQALPKLQSSYSTFKHSDDFVKLKVTNSSKAAQIENEVEQILKKGEGVVKGAGKYWRTASEMRDDVMAWAKFYREKLPSTRQLEKFNKACAASYNKADGTFETVFGRNGGVINTQAAQPTMSAEKGLGLHPELAKRLPEKSMWPNTANCAECDAVNQALHNGAKWDDIQIHTIDIRPDGTMTDVIQCLDCQNIFKSMYVTSQ